MLAPFTFWPLVKTPYRALSEGQLVKYGGGKTESCYVTAYAMAIWTSNQCINTVCQSSHLWIPHNHDNSSVYPPWLVASGMDKMREQGAPLPGNDKENWGNCLTGMWRKKEEREEEEKKKRRKEKEEKRKKKRKNEREEEEKKKSKEKR